MISPYRYFGARSHSMLNFISSKMVIDRLKSIWYTVIYLWRNIATIERIVHPRETRTHANETQFREFSRKHSLVRTGLWLHTTSSSSVSILLLVGEDFSNIPSTYGSRILRTENVRAAKARGVLRMLAITFTFVLFVLAGGKRASGPTFGLPSVEL